jgi:hypothetical protein
MANLIYCSACGRGIGAVEMPTHAELSEVAAKKGSWYAGIFRMVPANALEMLFDNSVVKFLCVQCTCGGGVTSGSEKEREKAGQESIFNAQDGAKGSEAGSGETSAQALYREHAALGSYAPGSAGSGERERASDNDGCAARGRG